MHDYLFLILRVEIIFGGAVASNWAFASWLLSLEGLVSASVSVFLQKLFNQRYQCIIFLFCSTMDRLVGLTRILLSTHSAASSFAACSLRIRRLPLLHYAILNKKKK